MPLSPYESYLDVLEHSLRLLPCAERAEWREEVRQHLQEIARAEEAHGLAPEEAVAAAMRQFGDAAQIGLRLAQAAECDPLTGRTAVALFCRPLIFAMILLIGLAYAYVLTDSLLLLNCLQGSGALAFVLVPLLGGRRVGQSFRSGQSPFPVALGLLLAVILSLPVAGVLLVPIRGATVGGAALDFPWSLLWLPLTGLSLLLSHRRYVRHPVTGITAN